MLEWRPRLILFVLVLTVVVLALFGGWANLDLIRFNWEW